MTFRDKINAQLPLQVSESQHRAMFQRITQRSAPTRRFSVALALTLTLLLLSAAALAATVYESVRRAMRPVAQMQQDGSLERWSSADQAALNALNLPSPAPEMAEGVAQSADAAPSAYALFTALWLEQEPTATADEIEAAFALWEREEGGVQAFDEAAFQAEYTRQKTLPDMRRIAQAYLSEVLSLSKQEREQCEIQIDFLAEYGIYQVKYLLNQEHFEKVLWYTPTGQLLEGTDAESCAFYQLIPGEAFPRKAGATDTVRAAFLRADAQEQAAFSQAWKPVMDAYLAEHPAFERWMLDSGRVTDAYMLTRHAYGVPDAEAISRAEALEIAKNAYFCSSESENLGTRFSQYGESACLYDISEPTQPLWRVRFFYHSGDFPGALQAGYTVILDARTGEVLRELQEADAQSPEEWVEFYV